MKAFLLLTISICFFLNVLAQNDSLGFTNKAEAKNSMVNGLKEGKWVEYYDSAYHVTKDTIAPYFRLSIYHEDKPFGMTREYYKNGKLEEEASYIDGKENGIEKDYYSNGKLMYEINFIDNKENGIERDYYKDGNLESETPYSDSLLNGIEKDYYESGELKSQTIWKFGQNQGRKEFYEDGKLKSEAAYNNYNAEIYTKTYDEKGNEIK